ncbi:MAG: hypothetical protein WDW36_005993 [Sanguina aurantia]
MFEPGERRRQESGSEQGSEGDPDSPCGSEDPDDVEVIAVVPAPDSKRQKLSTVAGTQRAASTGQAAQHTLDSFVTSHRAGPSQAAKQAPSNQPTGNLRQSLIVSSFGLTNASDPNSARCRQPGGCSTAATADESRMALAQLVNHRVFGNRSFRPRQREIIDFALSGKDCFVLMPTGGGKSLCYQLPAVIARGVTVVVCPLLSLMQDQVRALCTGPGGGVPATYLSSQQSQSEASAVYRELSKACPTVKLLYATPEQLVKSSGLRRILDQLHAAHRLARIVIDEAHCVSMWGHDFRPDYKHLSFLKGAFPTVPIMALTATATERVAKDILSTLGIPRAPVFQVNFFRENLRFMVQDKPYGKDEQGMPGHYAALVDYIEGQAEGCTGIVYCLSRDESEQVARFLCQSTDITAAAYHAGMTPKVRMEVQNKWRSGKVQVVVATIAFGMGIDKPDVRYVVHFTLSKSLEGYFQEAGRAGRDGLPSECVLMFAPRDGPRILNMLRMGPRASYKAGQEQLQHMIEYCKEGGACRHAILLKHFGQQLAGGASRCKTSCDNCDQRNRPKPQAAYEQDYQEYADCYDGDEGSRKPKPGAGGGSDSGGRGASATPGKRGRGRAGGSGGRGTQTGPKGGNKSGGGGGLPPPVPQLSGFVKASTLPMGAELRGGKSGTRGKGGRGRGGRGQATSASGGSQATPSVFKPAVPSVSVLGGGSSGAAAHGAGGMSATQQQVASMFGGGSSVGGLRVSAAQPAAAAGEAAAQSKSKPSAPSKRALAMVQAGEKLVGVQKVATAASKSAVQQAGGGRDHDDFAGHGSDDDFY